MMSGIHGTASDDTALLEAQNTESLDRLRGKVSVIRNVTLHMQRDIDAQNTVLDGLDDDFYRTRTQLRAATDRVRTLLRGRSTIQLALGGFLILLLLYFLFFR